MPVVSVANRFRKVPLAVWAAGALLVGCAARTPLPQPVEPLVATMDAAFRGEVPEFGSPAVELPAVHTRQLKSGVEVWTAERPGSGYVSLSLASRGGTLNACDSAESVRLTTRMVAVSPLKWINGDEVEPPVLRGKGLWFATSDEGVGFGIVTAPEEVEEGLTILSQTIQHTLLAPDRFDRVRLDELEAQRSRVSSHDVMLKLATTAALNEAVAERLVPGDSGRVREATMEQVRSCYQELLRPDRSVVVAVGDTSPAVVEALAERLFAQWEPKGPPVPSNARTLEPPAESWGADPKVSFLASTGGYQTELMLLQPAPPLELEGDAVPFRLLSRIAAGSLAARANLRLRHEAAVSYGSSFELRRAQGLGLLAVTARVDVDNTREATEGLIAMLRELESEEVAVAELDSAKSRELSELRRAASSNTAYASYLRHLFVGRQPVQTLDDLPERIAAVTPRDVQRVGRKYLRPAAVQVAASGDGYSRAELRFVGAVETFYASEE